MGKGARNRRLSETDLILMNFLGVWISYIHSRYFTVASTISQLFLYFQRRRLSASCYSKIDHREDLTTLYPNRTVCSTVTGGTKTKESS